ncbi:hypothetical protein FACS1894198_4780 [Clostridia bacterium]|nr:hypothetical protein FACS1894198_4780 [Clostridia bacterium]
MDDEVRFLKLLENRTAEADKLLIINSKIQDLLESSQVEATYPLLDISEQCFEELQLIDRKISELSHKSDARNISRIKKILAMNEPDNLTSEEQKMMSAMKTFAGLMEKIMEKNIIIKEIFLKEQQTTLSEIKSIRSQKAKLLHSKKFLDSMGLEEPNQWEIES